MATRLKYELCEILRKQGIKCLLWFEGAIAANGVPTVVFDLYLVVDNIAEAEKALTWRGWTPALPPSRHHFLSCTTPIKHCPLRPPNSELAEGEPRRRTWRLLAPSTQSCSPPSNGALPLLMRYHQLLLDVFLPPLSVLLDALIEKLLDPLIPDRLHDHLAVQLSYLYRHCQTLKTQNFADNLWLEHHQFHYNALSKPGLGTLSFTREQRQIRDDIRTGARHPHRNSWYLPPDCG